VKRFPKQWLLIGLGAAIAALSLVALGSQQSSARTHKPGGGALTTLGDPWSMGLDPTRGDRWSLGIYLCATDPTIVPVLDSVTPSRTVGSFDFLGAAMRRFAPTNSDPPIISVDGFPPIVPDTLVPVAGYRIEAGCSRAVEFSNYNELVLGVGRHGDSGGGWLGEDVHYHVGDRAYVLALDYVVVVCGPGAPASYC
jgi:hypothetical protein